MKLKQFFVIGVLIWFNRTRAFSSYIKKQEFYFTCNKLSPLIVAQLFFIGIITSCHFKSVLRKFRPCFNGLMKYKLKVAVNFWGHLQKMNTKTHFTSDLLAVV